VDFVAGNSTNYRNWVWKEKSVEPAIVFTLPNLQIFNSENVKNKECLHTQANGIG
jgi:hypothetical protein